jgi:hypothetical protein
MFSRATAIEFAAAMAMCFYLAGAAAQQAPDYAALIAALDRSAPDRAIDARRDPLQMLTFIGARPGMKVLDMGAGGGYSTELMARAVGPNGVVYGQNAPDFGARGKAAFEARETTPAGKPIVGLFYPFDDPLPADVRQDEQEAVCGAQAWRVSGDCGPFGRRRRGHFGRTFAPSYRGKRGAQRGGGGRVQARRRRRFLAPSRRHPRFHHPAADQACGRVRSQVSEAAARRNVAEPSGKECRATYLCRGRASGLNSQAWDAKKVPAINESRETMRQANTARTLLTLLTSAAVDELLKAQGFEPASR